MSQDKGRRNRGHFHKNKSQVNLGDKGREVLDSINENSPVMKQFREYAAELDTKHDRFERLVKISRDITIESKRIIFLLHTLDKESKRNAVLEEAEARLNKLIKVMFKNIALELNGEDQYLYLRAYRAGIQEFIEAITFYWFLQNSTLYDWNKIDESMTYAKEDLNPCADSNFSTNDEIIQTFIPPVEYILGIADLTGELMRKCINNLGSGDISSCYQTCNFVRSIYKGFLGSIGISGKEIGRKLYTLKQSLLKMENVCYMIKVRGSEIPKHMLADVALVNSEDMTLEDDEGYQVY